VTYVHGYDARESERLQDQAGTLVDLLHADTVYPDGSAVLEAGDVEEGMRAAEAIGDDTLQKQTQGRVVPDSFTHGSSAQRMEALRGGMTSGDPKACNYAR